MKRIEIILIFTTLWMIGACEIFNDGQPYKQADLVFDWETLKQQNIEKPDDDNLIEQFRDDAARLALRKELNQDDGYEGDYPPEKKKQAVFNAIVSIYNSEKTENRREVFDVHQISTFPNPVLDMLLVSFDDNEGWQNAWFQEEKHTGNDQVDELMDKYHFEIRSIHDGNLALFVVLESEKRLNIAQVATYFSEIEEVSYASPNSAIGDGNDMHMQVDDFMLFIGFSRGWGDCPAGCINREYWNYRVTPYGEVFFEGVEADRWQ